MDLFSLVATLGLDSSSFISGIQSAQDLFTGFANMVLEFSGDVLKTGMNFDQAMANVRAVLGEQEGTVENMQRLRAFGLEQASKSVFTAEDAGDAYYYMGMAGWKTEQMLKGLPAIMQLAAASGEDLGRVSDIVTDSLTAFGLGADDAQRYADILAQTATNANTNVNMMGETFKFVAPIAGSLGADVDDVAVSVGLMANAGIKSSMAGTALRSMMTRISSNAGATSKSLGALDIIQQKLGVNFWNSAGKMRDWGEFIDDVRGKWSKLSDQEQVSYAKTIASQYGMSGWLALMNAAPEDVKKLTDAIDESTGAAQRMSEVRLDNLAGDVDMFNSALDILKIAIYDDVDGPMREVVQWATDALREITDAVNENGLAGGLEVLGEKIRELGDNENVQFLLESIGGIVGTILEGALDTLLPKITEKAPQIISAFFSGAQGATMNTGEAGNLIGLASGFLGNLFKPQNGVEEAFQNQLGVSIKVNQTDIQAALDAAQENGDAYVTINGVKFPAGMDAITIMDTFTAATDACVTDGFAQAVVNGEDIFGVGAETIGGGLENAVTGGGTDGSASAAVAMEGVFATSAGTVASTLADAVGASGTAAGNSFAANLQAALSGHTFSINIATPGNPVEHNAKAMDNGRILTSPTIFGYADGAYQVAGDAGAEVVVGASSLQQMIANAVRAASAEQEIIVPRDNGPQSVAVSLQIGEAELARTVVPLVKQEVQRLGVELASYIRGQAQMMRAR